MKSNIFIPKRINVGYQNRSGTYTGKLAYIIIMMKKAFFAKKDHGMVGVMKIYQMMNSITNRLKALC